MKRKIKIEKPGLNDEELTKIIQTVDTSSLYLANTAGEVLRRRDKTIILLSAYCGFRPSEVLGLRWSDIDFQRKEIKIQPFNNKQRDATPALLSFNAEHLLREYFYFITNIIRSEWIFPSLITLEPITPDGFRTRLRKILKEAGLWVALWFTDVGQPISNYTHYSLRKFYGSKVYFHTNNAYKTMRALRQSKMSSVQPYITATKDDIRKAINESIPELADPLTNNSNRSTSYEGGYEHAL